MSSSHDPQRSVKQFVRPKLQEPGIASRHGDRYYIASPPDNEGSHAEGRSKRRTICLPVCLTRIIISFIDTWTASPLRIADQSNKHIVNKHLPHRPQDEVRYRT